MLGHDLTLWQEAPASSNVQNPHHFLRLRVRKDGSAVDFWCLGLTDPLSPDAKPELIDAASFKLD